MPKVVLSSIQADLVATLTDKVPVTNEYYVAYSIIGAKCRKKDTEEARLKALKEIQEM